MIRLPDIPQLQPEALNQPQVSARAAAAPAMALGEVATAIAGVSQHFHKVAVDVQRLENARMISDGRHDIAIRYAEFEAGLQTEPDPAKRINLTRDFLTNYKNSMDDPAHPPVVREGLRSHFEDFEAQALIGQTRDSANLAVRRATASMRNGMLTARTPEEVDAAADNFRDSGAGTPEEADTFRLQGKRELDLSVLQEAINDNPLDVRDAIDAGRLRDTFKNLSPADETRIPEHIRASIQRHRAEEMDLAENLLAQQKLDETALQAMRHLGENDLSALRRTIEVNRVPGAKDHSKAWDVLLSLRKKFEDPAISDEQYAEEWNNRRADVLALLPPRYQDDVKSELVRRSPVNRYGGRTESPAVDFESQAVESLKVSFNQGMFGDIKDESAASYMKAWNGFANAKAAIRRWCAKNPGADWDEVKKAAAKAGAGSLADSPNTGIPSAPPPLNPGARLKRITGKQTVDEYPDGDPGSSDALLPLLPKK